jgi:hypothetical protein
MRLLEDGSEEQREISRRARQYVVQLFRDVIARRPRVGRHSGEERERMVESQIVRRGVQDPMVHAAMRRIPRECFVPDHLARRAYEDRPLPIGEGQTISQLYIVAAMT